MANDNKMVNDKLVSLTDAEQQEHDATAIAWTATQKASAEANVAAAASKANAKSKLAALGLSEDEISAAFGI